MTKKQIHLDSPTTKKDLEKLLTKEEFNQELKKLLTKEEFKQELEKLATKEELVQLEKILRAEIRLTAEETKAEIGDKIQKANSLVLNVLDSFLKKSDASRQERTVDAEQKVRDRKELQNHGKRIRVFAST